LEKGDLLGLSELIDSADLVVVGSGFFGLTIAERSAAHGLKVLVIEKRDHIGGNAYSYLDGYTGVEVHKYGSHLFHTSSETVWEYVNRFTAFNSYRHSVFAQHANKIYSMPINLSTICNFFGKAFSPTEAKLLIESQVSHLKGSIPSNFEEKAISLVGKPLYEAFYFGYTSKQWGMDPSELPAEIVNRLPVRFDFNGRYFSDTWEGLPLKGYANWFAEMVKSPNIQIALSTDFFEIKSQIGPSKLVVYTGAIDKFFDYKHGLLGWRTLDFEIESLECDDFQGTSVMNYSDLTTPYTRIHEFKHLHPERDHKFGVTTIMKEFSRVGTRADDPYYPINSSVDRQALLKYRERAKEEINYIFGGRLGSYQYLDMHMAIASALQIFENEIRPRMDLK
jgi:UDP-galactopyranose mutase